MRGNVRQAVGVFLEIAGIACITAGAIKAECKRHKAMVDLHWRELDLAFVELHNAVLKIENKHLKERLEKYENEEEKD